MLDIKKALAALEKELPTDEGWNRSCKERVLNLWEDDPTYGNYPLMTPRGKGATGEDFMERVFKRMDVPVRRADNSGHDRIIGVEAVVQPRVFEAGGWKTEIKFSLAHNAKRTKGGVTEVYIKHSKWVVNHISKDKKYERVVFAGVNPVGAKDRYCIRWTTKADLVAHINQPDSLFSHQQGGTKIANDDYICNDVAALIKLPFMKDLSEW